MGLLRDFLKGAAAGLAGSAAMHAFRITLERIRPDHFRDGIFGFDREADVAAAQLLCEPALGELLPAESAARLGLTLHYIYGSLLGACYGVARARSPRISTAWGIPAGVALWLVADEVPIAVTGIANPFDKTLASHVSALAAHLLYATTMENTLRRW